MSDKQLRAVEKQLKDCINDKTTNFVIERIDTFHLRASIPGPIFSPYEGGIFDLDIVFPEEYPFRPPKIKFITKVYHPNVSSTSGTISLDVLAHQWSPALVLRTQLISIQALMSSPFPDDPLDVEVAEHYKASKQSFEETARYWTQVYARARVQIDEIALAGLEREHVAKFEWFGFDRSKVIEVLQRLNYRGGNVANISEEQVVEKLLE